MPEGPHVPPASEEIAVEAREISKSFPGVRALDQVSVVVTKGSCHALVGENGAGKSTLGKIISGLIQPDSGELRLFGELVRFHNPIQAIQAGVGIVHQELVFCENLSVAENLSLDDPPARGPFVNRKAMRERAEAWLAELGAGIDPDELVGRLPISRRQLVQIAGAVGRGARVLIFDEPTSSLSNRETEILFAEIRKLLSQGITCLYVSHRMEEIFSMCDTATVLRDGRVVGSQPVAELDRDSIVRLMIGREIDLATRAADVHDPGEVLLKVRGLTSPGKFSDVSFEARAGEVVGLAGLVGAGRTEIVESIFGLDSSASGEVEILGKSAQNRSPRRSLGLGIGLVPEDRKSQGLVLGMSARENISLPTLGRLSKVGFVLRAKERDVVKRYFDLLRVKAASTEAPALGLSGGNQQKLVMAKWLAAESGVLLLDEPTRGVDVGAKAEIHQLIRGLAASGKAVVVVSSELPELLAIASRILVVRNGRIVGELAASQASEESLMRLMTGVEEVPA